MTSALPTAQSPSVQIIRRSDRARALLDPERRRLVEALSRTPDSASGLARRLGEKRQRLNYHLRLLEDAGLVELVEERRKGNCTERVMRLVAQRLVLDPAAAGSKLAADPDEIGDRFSASYLVALASRAIGELADLLDRARKKGGRLATGSLNTQVRLGTPADFETFVQDLTRAVAEVVSRHHDERGGGRWFRVIAGAYPGPRPSAAHSEPPGDQR